MAHRIILASLLVSTWAISAPKNIVIHTPLIQASIVYAIDSGVHLHNVNINEIVSIASMTKIVTVLTILEKNQPLDEILIIEGKEYSSRLKSGMKVSRGDLIELALISSDNLASRTLIQNYPGGSESGIEAMNRLVVELGAKNTRFSDPTGLLATNVSTASDMALVIRASEKYNLFTKFANKIETIVEIEKISRTKKVLLWITGHNTNPFSKIKNNFEIIAAKTGFTKAAGFCLSMMISYKNERYILVTTGNKTKEERMKVMNDMISKITHYQYKFRVISDKLNNSEWPL